MVMRRYFCNNTRYSAPLVYGVVMQPHGIILGHQNSKSPINHSSKHVFFAKQVAPTLHRNLEEKAQEYERTTFSVHSFELRQWNNQRKISTIRINRNLHLYLIVC